MNVQFTENKLIKLFVEIDDLLLAYKKYKAAKGLIAKRKPTRTTALNGSEVCTILTAYHLSGYKCFEYYYKDKVLNQLQSYFPNAPSYECFLSYIPKAIDAMYLWLLYSCSRSDKTGLYFIDSKKMEVCHLKREHSNKVFQEYAGKGKCSVGWFYGLKIHLVINNLGQIISFELTAGNIADNNQSLLQKLLYKLDGCCIGDKGYLSKLFAFFYENGLHLLTKPRKNMKRKLVLPKHNKLLNKRGVIESVFDILTSICDIEHTRHRKANNAFTHIFAGLVAYQYLDKKPCVFFPSFKEQKTIVA
jgi:hypothetical protein